MENFVIPFLAVIAGGVITWLVSTHYYIKASDEMKEEAKQLRRFTNAILEAMEDKGEIDRTPAGDFIKGLRAKIEATPGMSGKLSE